jgi:hypothetical protein
MKPKNLFTRKKTQFNKYNKTQNSKNTVKPKKLEGKERELPW